VPRLNLSGEWVARQLEYQVRNDQKAKRVVLL